MYLCFILSQAEQEWRVLRFNEVTRQSVNRVQQLSQDGGDGITIQSACLAFEYLKTMASAGTCVGTYTILHHRPPFVI